MGENDSVGKVSSPFVAKVIGRGQVTIPRHIRELLGIAEGDYVECNVRGKVH